MKPGFMLVMVAALALMPPATCGGQTPSAAVHSVTVTLDPDRQEAVVTESANCTLNFTGHVAVEKLPVERMVVTLSASVDIGWTVRIDPDTMVFGSSTPTPFNVGVVVPPAAESTIMGKLVVTASSSGTGYNVEGSGNATITVAQYFRATLDSETPFFETGKRGVGTTFTIRVSNMGNGPDSYALDIGNLEKLRLKGWSAGLDKEVTPVLEPGAYCMVRVTVTPPMDAPAFEATSVSVDVKATSLGARAQSIDTTQTYPLYFYLRPIDPIFDVTAPIVIVAAVAVSAAIVIWRWHRWRKRRVLDVDEVPPT